MSHLDLYHLRIQHKSYNYNWVKELKLHLKISLDDNKKLLLIEEHLYNPENTITDSQIIIIFNNIYQHYVFHTFKNIDDNPVSMNVTQYVISILI